MSNTTPIPTMFAVDANAPDFMNEEAVEYYQEHGYLTLRNALNTTDIEALRADMLRLCKGEYGTFEGYIEHDESIPDADLAALKRYLCIHFPHKISDCIKSYLAHRAITQALTHLIGPNVKCMQSMMFIKSAGQKGQAWHQDEIFIPTRDRSLAGAWIAMDDATIENGCLWVIPKSHKPGILWPLAEQTDERFDPSPTSVGYPYSDDDAIPVQMKAGDILIFNGYLLHRSLPNKGAPGNFRRSLVNHYMNASSLLPWTNDLNATNNSFIASKEDVATCDCRDIVMVAGEDPYANMPLTEVNKPYVRPV